MKRVDLDKIFPRMQRNGCIWLPEGESMIHELRLLRQIEKGIEPFAIVTNLSAGNARFICRYCRKETSILNPQKQHTEDCPVKALEEMRDG